MRGIEYSAVLAKNEKVVFVLVQADVQGVTRGGSRGANRAHSLFGAQKQEGG